MTDAATILRDATRDLTDEELAEVQAQWEHSRDSYERRVAREIAHVLAAGGVAELNDAARIARECRAARRRLAVEMAVVIATVAATWTVCGWLFPVSGGW